MFGIVVVLGHPLLENIDGFRGQVAAVRDVNEIFHQHLQPATVVTSLSKLLLEDNQLLPGLLPLGRKRLKAGRGLQPGIALELEVDALGSPPSNRLALPSPLASSV